jgi:membrane associated rhomboid family serine protease
MKKLNLTEILGLHYPASDGFYLHQIITYMFMHGSLSHLFFNMFAVYMFGRILESVWGTKRFLTYYMITGIGAGLINILVAYVRIKAIEANLSPEVISQIYREGYDILRQSMNYTDPIHGHLNILINTTTVGASGAVFGILLAFGMLFPNMSLYIIPIPFPVKAKYMVTGYGIIELFAGFAEIRGDNVAHFAHLGGMLFGIILVLYWRKKDGNNGRYFY